eukprot:15467440-Alexandrium_andersonii.AAC.1
MVPPRLPLSSSAPLLCGPKQLRLRTTPSLPGGPGVARPGHRESKSLRLFKELPDSGSLRSKELPQLG